jgi:hypothetical protein
MILRKLRAFVGAYVELFWECKEGIILKIKINIPFMKQ